MLSEITRSINNHFAIDQRTGGLYGAEQGEFAIADGRIAVKSKYLVGQYIAISGSMLNDGVYKIDAVSDGAISVTGLIDETFDGTIYSLRIPREFIALCDRINAFAESEDGQAGNIVSAGFGIQSQSFATDEAGQKSGWEYAFRTSLHRYRRAFPDIRL